jgi:hypothetical protein
MTIFLAKRLDTEGVHSLEVRWIFPGRPTAAMTDWYRRFPAETLAIEDIYLLDPHLPGLSVKVRGGWALEVKLYHGSPGLLDVVGRVRGRLESWQKWSFPCDSPSEVSADPAGWRPVSEQRRISRFSLAGGSNRVRLTRQGEQTACAVELTEIRTSGEAWWTLGLEATGPANMLRSELEAAAAVVFTDALPGGLEPGMKNSTSYARWLRRRPKVRSTPNPERSLSRLNGPNPGFPLASPGAKGIAP